MWIQCTNDAVESLYIEDVMEEPVEFNDNGRANVKKSVGEELTERRFSIVKSSTSDDEDGESNEQDNQD